MKPVPKHSGFGPVPTPEPRGSFEVFGMVATFREVKLRSAAEAPPYPVWFWGPQNCWEDLELGRARGIERFWDCRRSRVCF